MKFSCILQEILVILYVNIECHMITYCKNSKQGRREDINIGGGGGGGVMFWPTFPRILTK
jgi:hypothetical protein